MKYELLPAAQHQHQNFLYQPQQHHHDDDHLLHSHRHHHHHHHHASPFDALTDDPLHRHSFIRSAHHHQHNNHRQQASGEHHHDYHRHHEQALQYQQHYLTIEDIKSTRNSCWLCGCNWLEDHVSLDCPECDGYALTRPCPSCDGKCNQTWTRNISSTHDRHKASWTGQCKLKLN